MSASLCQAVIFDMDGVIIDSEEGWERARLATVAQFGGVYHPEVARDVMGMTPTEWAGYLHDRVGIPLAPETIEREVTLRLIADYERDPPFFPGAIETVRAVSRRWPAGLASSSSRELIDLVIGLAGLADAFTVTVSAVEAGRGKPAPDVYLKAAALLAADPRGCVAIEDSSNGIRSAKNAGMRVVAVPHPVFPPSAEAVALADAVVERIADFTPALIAGLFAANSAG